MAVAAILLIPQPVARVSFHGREFALPVSANKLAREHGLGAARGLPPSGGMLFVFPTDGLWRIWMKDMRFNLDIVWLDAHKRVVHIVHNATPASYPDVFVPSRQARYVLELPSGGAAGLTRGETVRF